MFLKPGKRHDIFQNVKKNLADTSNEFLASSEFIMFTNVPCADANNVTMFPDLQSMFGTGFGATRDLFTGYDMRMFIFWKNVSAV